MRRVAFALGLSVLLASTNAGAVSRTCGSDPLANTEQVLCAPPSGPCDKNQVTLGAPVEVADGSCLFDLGGRALYVDRTFDMAGNGSIDVRNAGDVTVTRRGRLKARGDLVPPFGLFTQGGKVALHSAGTIVIAGLIDVSGDPGGLIQLEAAGDISLQNTSVLRGNGLSAVADEGERFADGAEIDMLTLSGSITIDGAMVVRGANQGAGGLIDLLAGRNITLNQLVDLSGGASDGGDFSADCGDDLIVKRAIIADSRVAGGFGGFITLEGGDDFLMPGGVAGGGVELNNSTLRAQGSEGDSFGGDGGEVDISAFGPVHAGPGAVIRVDASTSFDGSGGSVFVDSGDSKPFEITALDGDVDLDGVISARAANAGGDGGDMDLSAGRNLALKATVDLTGRERGGDIELDAGRDVLVAGTVTAAATNPGGGGGFVAAIAGVSAADATLTVARSITATGGASGGGDIIELAGCTLAIAPAVRIDGRSGGRPVGTQIWLASRGPMVLGAGSQYLASANGSVRLSHPATVVPSIGAGVVFNPPPVHDTSLPSMLRCGAS